MSADDAARAEAERIFPDDLPLYRFDDLEPYVSGVRDSDIREHQQDAFAKGAAWQRAQIAALHPQEPHAPASAPHSTPTGSA